MKHIMLLTYMLFIVCGNPVFAQSQPTMKDVVRQLQSLEDHVQALYQQYERQHEQIRKLEEEHARLREHLSHLEEREDVKHAQLEKMRGEVINIRGTWTTDKGALRMISGSGGGYLLEGSNENLVKGTNRDGRKKAYGHRGTIYYTQVGDKNTLEGNLYDIAGYCCSNQGVIEITVINEKRLDVVSRWWKQGIPEKEAKQVQKFVEIWRRQ